MKATLFYLALPWTQTKGLWLGLARWPLLWAFTECFGTEQSGSTLLLCSYAVLFGEVNLFVTRRNMFLSLTSLIPCFSVRNINIKKTKMACLLMNSLRNGYQFKAGQGLGQRHYRRLSKTKQSCKKGIKRV